MLPYTPDDSAFPSAVIGATGLKASEAHWLVVLRLFEGSVHNLIIWRLPPLVSIQDLPILVLLHLQTFTIRSPSG